MRKHQSPYKIGLGRAFLNRAGLIFTFFITITLLSTGSALYAEYKTGQLQEKVVKPVQKFFSEVAKSFEDTDPPKNLTNPNTLIATSSATIKIETNIKTGSGNTGKTTNTTTTITYPTPKPVQYNTKPYEDSLKELDEWSRQKQAESEKAYQQAVERSKQQTQSSYQQKVDQMYKDLEEWKKQNGF